MALLHEKGVVVSSLFFITTKTRQLSESLSNTVIIKPNNSKGYKAIDKTPVSTVCNVILKFPIHKTVKTLPGKSV